MNGSPWPSPNQLSVLSHQSSLRLTSAIGHSHRLALLPLHRSWTLRMSAVHSVAVSSSAISRCPKNHHFLPGFSLSVCGSVLITATRSRMLTKLIEICVFRLEKWRFMNQFPCWFYCVCALGVQRETMVELCRMLRKWPVMAIRKWQENEVCVEILLLIDYNH